MACSYNFYTQELEAEGFAVSLRPAWATEEVCLRNLEMREKNEGEEERRVGYHIKMVDNTAKPQRQ